MSELTVISPTSIAEAKDLATTLAAARTLPEALQKSPADVLAIILAGAELGLAPMQSLRGLVLIKGKPTLSADAMGALVKRRSDVCKWLRLVSSTPEAATYETQRAGEPEPTRMSFTIADAQRAGLNGDNWKKFPAAMLRARALTAICRAVYPDLILGVYDPDELEPQPEREVSPPPATPLPAVTAPVVDAELVRPSPPKAEPLDAKLVESGIAAAKSLADLEGWVSPASQLPEPAKSEVRKRYNDKLMELRKAQQKPAQGAPA